MNFVKIGKQEVNICIWELINKREDNDTWECLRRLQKLKKFVVSLYKKTCKLNNLTIEEEIIQKISSFLNDQVVAVVSPAIDDVEEDETVVETAPTQHKMISRKRS
jgi:hypothetical protein